MLTLTISERQALLMLERVGEAQSASIGDTLRIDCNSLVSSGLATRHATERRREYSFRLTDAGASLAKDISENGSLTGVRPLHFRQEDCVGHVWAGGSPFGRYVVKKDGNNRWALWTPLQSKESNPRDVHYSRSLAIAEANEDMRRRVNAALGVEVKFLLAMPEGGEVMSDEMLEYAIDPNNNDAFQRLANARFAWSNDEAAKIAWADIRQFDTAYRHISELPPTGEMPSCAEIEKAARLELEEIARIHGQEVATDADYQAAKQEMRIYQMAKMARSTLH